MDLAPIRLVLEQDDPWTTDAANRGPITSSAYQEKWDVAHHRDGSHAQPVAQAAAIVAWNGSVATVLASVGITRVARISTGLWEVQIDFLMAAPDEWILDVHPMAVELAGAYEVQRSKSLSYAQFEMRTIAGALQDSAFLVLAYGNRL